MRMTSTSSPPAVDDPSTHLTTSDAHLVASATTVQQQITAAAQLSQSIASQAALPSAALGVSSAASQLSSESFLVAAAASTAGGSHRNGVKRGFDDQSDAKLTAGRSPSNKRLQTSGYGQMAAASTSQQQAPTPSAAVASTAAGGALSPKAEYRSESTGEGSPTGTASGRQQHFLPNRVLLLRNLSPSVVEVDVEQLVAPFSQGYKPKIYLQSTFGQAFVEFADETTAASALNYLRMHPVSMKGSVVQATFSRRDSVTTSEEKVEPFRVVLASVTNIAYAVDIELINFLFSKYGVVEKIVTFSKSPVTYQALVQFADADQAMAAMLALHNRNIYDGCNSLQIQPSRMQELTVKSNNTKSWDFTLPAHQQPQQQGRTGGPMSQGGKMQQIGGPGGNAVLGFDQQQHISPAAACGVLPTPHGGPGGGGGGQQHVPSGFHPHMEMSGGGGMNSMLHMHPQFQQLAHQHGGGAMGPMGMHQKPLGGSWMPHATLVDKLPRELKDINLNAANPRQTPVIIIYNLTPDEVNVTKLFHLFSLYGTVLRIKILREKKDTALVQFSDPLYATIAYNFLQGAPVFQEDPGLQIGYSKNTEVKLPPQGSSDTETELKRTRGFSMRDQRYGQTDDMEKYLRGASRPTCTLFIANIHEEVTEEEMKELFRQYGEVKSFKFRPPKELSRKKMAFVEMGSERESILALCNLHNHRLKDAFIKVAFSKTNIAAATTAPAAAPASQPPAAATTAA